MKLTSNAMSPYKVTWAQNASEAQKWLTLRLEEGYVLESSSSVPIPYMEPGREGAIFQTMHMKVDKQIFLAVRYEPDAAEALVRRCNGAGTSAS